MTFLDYFWPTLAVMGGVAAAIGLIGLIMLSFAVLSELVDENPAWLLVMIPWGLIVASAVLAGIFWLATPWS